MQDGTYPPRNFATLGPSGLRPPFTGIYREGLNPITLSCSTGQVSDFIFNYIIYQNLMFLINSRRSLFNDILILFFPKLQSEFAEFLQ